jgi:predicted Ser/Thr protein kinase
MDDQPVEIGNGRYRVIRRLGSGGTGTVYQAADRMLGRTVAIKALHHSQRLDLLRAEGRSLARLSHPNVVALHDLIEQDGRPYLVMEYVEGSNLEQWLAEHGSLGVEQALGVFRRIASAVQAAHAHGILHCDLKPANILISTAGEVKLTDFTLAQIESGGQFHGVRGGSAAYAAPEQMDGGPVDRRTDVYGLGAVLARMAGGIDRSSVEGQQVVAAIARATAADADQRFATVDELLNALPASDGPITRIAASSQASELTRVVPGAVEGPVPHRPRRRLRRPLVILPLAAVLIAVLSISYFTASAQPATVILPDLSGVPQASALHIARSLALQTRMLPAYSSTVPSGIVLAQRPAPGTKVNKGSTVTLIVSEGPRPVTVPSVEGLSQDAAAAQLQRLGFHVQVQTDQWRWQDYGNVVDQVPAAGGKLLPGQTVTITVSVKPCVVGVIDC